MKKIIKKGHDSFIAVCGKCGCEFSYELSDIELNSVKCPYCNSYVGHPIQNCHQTVEDNPLSSNFFSSKQYLAEQFSRTPNIATTICNNKEQENV